MNKQELIEELECLVVSTDSVDYLQGANYAVEKAISLAEQLDEPKKVVVPKFVADWLDKHKSVAEIIDLFSSVEHATDSDGFIAENWKYSGEFYDWLADDADTLFTLCDAIRYGYEVEKEPRYYVKLPEIGYMRFGFCIPVTESIEEAKKYTEQEIKAIDERYWAFAVKVVNE